MTKMLNVLKEVDMEKLVKFIDEEVKPEFISSLNGEKFQGWHHDITVDIDGEFSISSQLSCGTQSMALYKGKEVKIYNLPSYFDWNFEFTIDDFTNLGYEEEQKLLEKVIINAFIDEEEVEDMNIDYFFWNYNCELEEAFKELFEDKYNEMYENWIECEWDSYKERMIDDIKENIVNEIYYLENNN